MSKRRGLDTQTIFAAAAEVVEEYGLENLSLLKVAEKLGVKSPSLYNHLDGVQGLSYGLAGLAVSRLEETIRNAAIGRSEDEALKAIASEYRKFAMKNPELYKAILRFPAYEDKELQESGHDVIRILYQVLKPYQLNKEETLHFARGFRSALHGFISLESVGFFRCSEVDIDESYEQMVTRFISTLKKKEVD